MVAFLAAAINMLLAVYAWRHREAPGATAFAVLELLITHWSIMSAFEALSGSFETWIFWSNLSYVGLAGAPVALLIFSLQYTKRAQVTKWHVLALCVIPILTQIFIWNNDQHGWWWLLDGSAPSVWFWIHSAYSFTLIFIGLTLISLAIVNTSTLRRWQVALLLFGIVLPLFVNVLLTFDLLNFYSLDLTPVAFTVSGIAFAWSMYRHRLFDLTPLARETLIDGMADGMLVLDTHYHIADHNPAARVILSLTASDLDEASIATVLPIWSTLQPAAAAGHEAHADLVLGDDANPRYYEVHVTPLHDREHVLSGYVLLLHDITERKLSEAAIQQYARELETRNAELDAFAHTVAHDLKTPLTSLIGFSTLLDRRAPRWSPQKVQENVHRITQTGHKMTNIINELLLLSSVRKVDAVASEPLDMGTIVAEAVHRFSDRIASSHADIVMPDTWPQAVGYAPWVEEVWVNYISNALKYGVRPDDDIPPHIELGFEEDAPARGQDQAAAFISFWCRDNGPGITDEAQQQLFIEFSRLESARAEGHGLGLSIVRRIITKLGGDAGVESVIGTGSTFWFTLPVA